MEAHLAGAVYPLALAGVVQEAVIVVVHGGKPLQVASPRCQARRGEIIGLELSCRQGSHGGDRQDDVRSHHRLLFVVLVGHLGQHRQVEEWLQVWEPWSPCAWYWRVIVARFHENLYRGEQNS